MITKTALSEICYMFTIVAFFTINATVNRTLLNISSPKIKGIFWWEPAVTGGLESRSFFGRQGNALPVMDVFNKFRLGQQEEQGIPE